MAISSGDKLGPYEILERIGAGGMGEVYRARDTRLGRDVAIKVSAAQFTERFEREARAVAALNHPNICTLHDVGPNYLVMEYVEGEPPQGPMPLDDALRIARQIVEALSEAHEKNIVHRDLKPGNIRVKPDGTVKVLDFGLAKHMQPSESASEHSPTLSMAATQAGAILGTAAYMAPEQARGKSVDRRADIWAFGVVFYEMLTGHRLFQGEDVTETLASVVKEQPDLTSVPVRVRRLLGKCLEKDPNKRLRDIGDVWELLQEEKPAAEPVAVSAPITEARARRSGVTPWAIAAVCALAAAGLGLALWAPWKAAPEPAKVVRFHLTVPENVSVGQSFALSPDGAKLAFYATGPEGAARVWIRAMDTLEPHPLAGTESGGSVPLSWSYDSRFVLFNADAKLKKVDVAGGPPQTLCEAPAVVIGASWNREGVVLYGLNNGVGIQRVSSTGGTPTAVTALNASRKDTVHAFPVFLPDGRHFLYLVLAAATESSGIYLGSLDSKPGEQFPKRLVASSFGPAFVPVPDRKTGEIVFERDDPAGATVRSPPSGDHRRGGADSRTGGELPRAGLLFGLE